MVAVALALALTLLLLAGLDLLLTQHAAPAKPIAHTPRPTVRLMRLAQSSPKRMKSVVKKRQKKKKKRAPEVTKLKGQVVETARPEDERVPEKTRYLGKFNMRVEREQKSRGKRRKGRQLGTRQVENPSKIQSPKSKSLKRTRIARRNTPKPSKAAKRQPTPLKPSIKQVAKSTRAPLVKNGPGQSALLQETAQPNKPSVVKTKRHAMLLPATSSSNILHNIQTLAGSPGSDDYLPDVRHDGATNLLNTRKFRYWDFFQRVRERVRSEWNPTGAWRSRDPSGKRFGVRDRLTVLRVRLKNTGDLKSIQVHKQSGLGFLDAEARRAFMAAGPYPNPPRGLVNEHGEVEFQFGFMFEISASRFRFHRFGR